MDRGGLRGRWYRRVCGLCVGWLRLALAADGRIANGIEEMPGVNFSLYFSMLRRRNLASFRDVELRVYAVLLGVAVAAVASPPVIIPTTQAVVGTAMAAV